MKDLTTGIYGKISGSSFSSDIGGRLYKGQAPDGATYPYAVYLLVSAVPDLTFTSKYEDVVIQFSLFSTASGSTEIEDMYTHLTALYDECTLSITGETLIWMVREFANLSIEEHTTPTGTQRVWAYHVRYRVIVKV